jgi:hypothetical protein
VEQEETAVAKQRRSKHIPAPTKTLAKEKLLDVVFSLRSVSYQSAVK